MPPTGDMVSTPISSTPRAGSEAKEEEREAEEGSGASETSDADGPGLIVRLGVSRPELADAKEEARERWRWGVLGDACAE